MHKPVRRSGAWVLALAAACVGGPLQARSTSGSPTANRDPAKSGATPGRDGTAAPVDRTQRASGNAAVARKAGGRGADDSMDAWIGRHAQAHQGRISREAYLGELARRWDSADRELHGLTPAELSRLTGRVEAQAQ